MKLKGWLFIFPTATLTGATVFQLSAHPACFSHSNGGKAESHRKKE